MVLKEEFLRGFLKRFLQHSKMFHWFWRRFQVSVMIRFHRRTMTVSLKGFFSFQKVPGVSVKRFFSRGLVGN